jgi:hypothetical protein
MAKTRYSLPEPPGCGGTGVMLILACVLIIINGFFAFSLLAFAKRYLPEGALEARWEQALLFLLPAVGLLFEFWGLSVFARWMRTGWRN